MLGFLRLTVLFVVAISCLASAFSTLFVTEAPGEVKKMVEMETKTLKTEGNNVDENNVIVETIPFFTNVITKVEDAVNLTPLKVATIISAQHLIDSVNNIAVTGNLPQDTLNMLGNIVEEFNKTTQIIKLTAEYVNISSHYILDSFNQLAKQNCDVDYIRSTMKAINANFLNVISNHVKVAVKEITEKTAHREMTGTDVLVSSAYHIVAAFQEMTSQVMSFKTEDYKCNIPKTPKISAEVNSMVLEEKTDSPKHDETHQSIKKEEAFHDTKPIFIFGDRVNMDNTLSNKNNYDNSDLTIEIYPREPTILKNEDKESKVKQGVNRIPESLKVAFLPEIKTTKVGNNEENPFTSKLGRVMGMLSPESTVNNKNKKLQEESNQNDPLDSLNVYYYPLKTIAQNQNSLPNANIPSYLKVPKVVNNHYIPQDLKTNLNDDNHVKKSKQVITPLKTFSLFETSNFWNYNMKPKQKQEYITKKSEGTQTNSKNFDDTIIDNLNRQDLTLEVFSPEAFIYKGKDVASSETEQGRNILSKGKNTQSAPNAKWMLGGFKSRKFRKPRINNRLKYKNKKNFLDRELASSAVDSLSNVPPMSYEHKEKNFREKKVTKTNPNVQKSFSTVLMPWDKRVRQNQNPPSYKSQQKHSSCGDRVEPVCGVDNTKSNFIIFTNDCERRHHNSLYKSNYEPENIDTCVGFLLTHSSGKPTNYMNIIPR